MVSHSCSGVSLSRRRACEGVLGEWPGLCESGQLSVGTLVDLDYFLFGMHGWLQYWDVLLVLNAACFEEQVSSCW
jgi:hypothetical protein